MTDSSDEGWHFIGKHSLRFEPPDIVFSRPDGDMSVEQMLALTRHATTFPQPEKGFFMIIDAAKGGRADPASLKVPELQELNRTQRGVIYLNARFYHRTLIDIFQRANKLLKLSHTNAPIHFFDTEAQARAWIAEERCK